MNSIITKRIFNNISNSNNNNTFLTRYSRIYKNNSSFIVKNRNRSRNSSSTINIKDNNSGSTSNNNPIDKRKTKSYNLFLSCSPGLESIVTSEVKDLFNIHNNNTNTSNTNTNNNDNQCSILHKENKDKVGGIYIKVHTVSDILKCHLHLGTISNIFIRICKPFKSRTFYELENNIINKYMIQNVWNDLFIHRDDRDIEFSVVTKCNKSKLLHTKAINERVINGIYHCLNISKSSYSKSGNGNDNGNGNDDKNTIIIKLMINVYRDKFEILLNTSSNGIPIHKRGYRKIPTKAPLREDLVYATLYSSGLTLHNNINTNDESLLVIDPFCGSGTIAIEAASILYKLPPGRLRSTPLLGTTLYNPTLWSSMVQQATNDNNNITNNKIKIMASDRDKGAIDACKQNAINANVNQYIHFQHLSFSQCLDTIKKDQLNYFPHDNNDNKTQEEKQTKLLIRVITNPPYGIRTRASSSNKNKKSTSASIVMLEMYQKFGHMVNTIFNNNNNDAINTSSTTTIVRKNSINTTTSASTTNATTSTTIVGNDRDIIRKTGITNLKTKFITNHGGMKIFVLSNS